MAQIETRFPGAREPETDARLAPVARLAAALLRVSEHALAPRGERLVLLIDGLVQIDLDDAPSFADDNAATVRAFWDQAAPELGLDAAFVAQAVERASGNLQHARLASDARCSQSEASATSSG